MCLYVLRYNNIYAICLGGCAFEAIVLARCCHSRECYATRWLSFIEKCKKASTPLKQSTFGRVLQKKKKIIGPFTNLTKTWKNITIKSTMSIQEHYATNQTLVQTYSVFNNWYISASNRDRRCLLFVRFDSTIDPMSKGKW